MNFAYAYKSPLLREKESFSFVSSTFLAFLRSLCLLLLRRSSSTLFEFFSPSVSHLAMKPGGSTLNPYAAAYVPLSKREGSLGEAKPATNQYVQHQPHHVAHGYGVQGYPGPQMSMQPKKASEMVYNQQMKDEDLEMDMDIEFLLATFSGLSHESINDVYLANNGDLDATIEMLNQLEIYSNEAQEYLPDTLDIGDVPETIPEPSTSTASKQKNEASASSSLGTHNPTVSSSS